MASAAGLRPNHYEVLGLSPSASQDEISRAFAVRMSMFGAHSVAGAAQMSLAFEVLRDPARRRAYDRSLGLIPAPEPKPEPRQWTMQGAAQGGPAFIGSAWTRLTAQAASEGLARPVARSGPESEPKAPVEPKLATFIASSVREPADPVVRESAGKRPQSSAVLQRDVEQLLKMAATEVDDGRDTDDRTSAWKRAALTVGGLVVAAGLIGTYAGLSVRNADDAPQADAGIAAGVAAATPRPKAAAPSPAPAQAIVEAPLRAEPIVAPTRRAIPSQPSHSAFAARAADQLDSIASGLQDGQPADAATAQADAATDPSATEPAAAQPVTATMPLPNKVIARTIQKIGYACGSVASTAAVDGAAPGVYNVTCSSGQSYQATPVHGRYRFRRLRNR